MLSCPRQARRVPPRRSCRPPDRPQPSLPPVDRSRVLERSPAASQRARSRLAAGDERASARLSLGRQHKPKHATSRAFRGTRSLVHDPTHGRRLGRFYQPFLSSLVGVRYVLSVELDRLGSGAGMSHISLNGSEQRRCSNQADHSKGYEQRKQQARSVARAEERRPCTYWVAHDRPHRYDDVRRTRTRRCSTCYSRQGLALHSHARSVRQDQRPLPRGSSCSEGPSFDQRTEASQLGRRQLKILAWLDAETGRRLASPAGSLWTLAARGRCPAAIAPARVDARLSGRRRAIDMEGANRGRWLVRQNVIHIAARTGYIAREPEDHIVRRLSWRGRLRASTRRLSAKDIERRERLSAAVFLVFATASPVAKASGAAGWVVIALLVLGLFGAIAGLAQKWRHERAKTRESQELALWFPPVRLRAAAANGTFYEVGVETEAPDALQLLGLQPGDHAEYVRRTVDDALQHRMRGAVARGGAHLIVVAGPSKAGKSRTLLEAAAQVLGEAWLIAPRHASAIAALARGMPPQGLDEQACVVWVDDIEEVVRRSEGLNEQTLDAFNDWNRSVLILATRGGRGVRAAGPDLERFARITGALTERYPPIRLAPLLDSNELDDARAAFGADVASRIEAEGLGEFMIAAPRLIDRLMDTECRAGQAIVRAAIDWRRAGLLRPMALTEIEDLHTLYLIGFANADRFRRGMEWATEPLYSKVALLSAVADGEDSYQPYAYLVEHAARSNEPINPELLDRLISDYATSADELTRIGDAAYYAGDHERAERAFGRGDQLGGGRAAYSYGALLSNRGDTDGAEAAFRRGDERGHAASAYELERVLRWRGDVAAADAALYRADERGHPHAAWKVGQSLSECGDLSAAEAAFRRSDERGDAEGANSLGFLLTRRDDAAEAEAAFRRADERGLALGAMNLGVMLQARGDVAGAAAAYGRADERGHDEAANNLGAILRQRGDLAAAEAAFRRAEERGCRVATENLGLLLNSRGDVDKATEAYGRADSEGSAEGAHRLGELLARVGDIDGAEAAFRRADDRGHGPAATSLGVLLIVYRDNHGEAEAAFRRGDGRGCLHGTSNLGLLLLRQGDDDAAEAVLRRADELGNDHAPSILGTLLSEREDFAGAEAAFRRAVERGSAHGANNLGVLLSARGDLEGSANAFRLADERGCATGAFQHARLLRRYKCYAEAARAFRRADERGHAGGAYEVAVSLDTFGKRKAAAIAYRRARNRAMYHNDVRLAERAREALDRLGEPLEDASDPDDIAGPCCGLWQ